MPSLVDQYFTAVNTEDWDLLATLWHPDGELRAVGAPVRVGRVEVLAHYPKVLAGFASHHDEPTRVVSTEDTCLVEIHFVGETVDGKPVEFDAVDVFDFADGLIHRLSSWYDTAAVARQVRGR